MYEAEKKKKLEFEEKERELKEKERRGSVVLELIEKVNNMKQEHENKTGLLKAEIQKAKLESGGDDTLRQEIDLLTRKNEELKAQNESLGLKVQKLSVEKG